MLTRVVTCWQNTDGRLSRKEFRTFTQSTINADGQLSGLEERGHFDSIDANRDGSISIDEFMGSSQSAQVPESMQDPEAAATAAIAHFDSVRAAPELLHQATKCVTPCASHCCPVGLTRERRAW